MYVSFEPPVQPVTFDELNVVFCPEVTLVSSKSPFVTRFPACALPATTSVNANAEMPVEAIFLKHIINRSEYVFP